MQAYYKNYYPYRQTCRFFELVGPLEKLEFAVESQTFFKRYLSVANAVDLNRLVVSIDDFAVLHAGAVWSGTPAKAPLDEQAKLWSSRPKMRAFVIDIDLTDYAFGVDKNDIHENDRHFCVVGFGMELLREILFETFGFADVFVFYSGRRGAHLYVLDERACALDDVGRAAVIGFLTAKTGRNGRVTAAGFLDHPVCHSRYQKSVLPFFENTVVRPRSEGGIGLLDEEEGVDRVLRLLDFKTRHLSTLRAEMLGRLPNLRYNHLRKRIRETAETLDAGWMNVRLAEVVLTFVWPRADVAVSEKLNHLLKVPFAAHMATGRIAVPITGDAIAFAPHIVPTVDSLDSFGAHVDAFKKELDRMENSRRRLPEPEPVFQMELCNETVEIEDLAPPSAARFASWFERHLSVRVHHEDGSVELSTRAVFKGIKPLTTSV